jgi:hypothetical protein
MNDALDDLAMMRAAGAGPVFEDTEHLYPPTKWAAHPGAMPTVADTLNRMHAAEARVTIVESELEKVRGLLKALVSDEAPIVAFNDDYPPDDGLSEVACLYCQTGNGRCDTEYEWHVNLSDPANHTPDCPWRLAAEYVQQMEASNATHPA